MTSALLSSNGIKIPEFPNESFQEEWHIKISDNQTYGWGNNDFTLPPSFIGARVKIYSVVGRNVASGTTDYTKAWTSVLGYTGWAQILSNDKAIITVVNQSGFGASSPPQQWNKWDTIVLPDNKITLRTRYGGYGYGSGLHFREVRILRY